ncbi:MAG: acetolactate synthase [Planctomycetales bacterium]
MPSQHGGKSATGPSTMRGRNWPALRQFCVFVENHVGSLQELMRQVESENVRVIGLSVVDSIDFAVVRVMFDNYERAQEALKLSSFPFSEKDLIGVELPDDPQPYARICTLLVQAEVNIAYSYPLLFRRHGRGAIALCVDDVDQGLRALTEAGLAVVTEGDLLEDDEML